MNQIFNSKIKAILFDMDGVVIDSEKLYFQSEEKLLSKYGVKFSDSDWLYIKGCTEKQFYDLVYSKFDINIPRNKLINQGREFLKQTFTEKLEYMIGFEDIYKILNERYKLALVTSTGPELVTHINKLLSIEKKFDLMINSTHTQLHKPNPEPYLKAMEYLNLESYECIVIEDSVQGIKSGKAAGCFVIALEGSIEKQYLQAADYIIADFNELHSFLKHH